MKKILLIAFLSLFAASSAYALDIEGATTDTISKTYGGTGSNDGTISGVFVMKSDCSGETAGACIDTDNGYLYIWDGTDSMDLAGTASWQPLDADLTTYAGITPSANTQTLLQNSTFADWRTDLAVTTAANAAMTGDPTITDATPTVTLQDSDNAAGTAAINANSSGGANDIILTLGVEDSTGEGAGYLQLDGVNEQIIPLKPLAIGPLTINGTADSTSDGTCAGTLITGTAGAALSAGDVVYLASADSRWELADNDSTTEEANTAQGFVILAATGDGDPTTVCTSGKMRLDSWNWSGANKKLWLSSTAGDATETRPISASSAVQELAHTLSDDEIFIDIHPIDFSLTRTGTDADGRTLTCLEVQNTWWDGAGTFVGPALSTCPAQNFTLSANAASDLTYDPNASDDTLVDAVANADGHNWSSPDAIADQITCTQHDADTIRCVTNGGWTAE